MSGHHGKDGTLIRGVGLLIVLQLACVAFFVLDVGIDLMLDTARGLTTSSWHDATEVFAVLTLLVAVGLEIRLVRRLLRRQAVMEHELRVAGAAVQDVVVEHFERWGLTAAEADVAMFLVKGLSIAEIAGMRGSSEATVKSHLNAIYRKSGSSGRPDLLAQILDSLMGRAPKGTPE